MQEEYYQRMKELEDFIEQLIWDETKELKVRFSEANREISKPENVDIYQQSSFLWMYSLYNKIYQIEEECGVSTIFDNVYDKESMDLKYKTICWFVYRVYSQCSLEEIDEMYNAMVQLHCSMYAICRIINILTPDSISIIEKIADYFHNSNRKSEEIMILVASEVYMPKQVSILLRLTELLMNNEMYKQAYKYFMLLPDEEIEKLEPTKKYLETILN